MRPVRALGRRLRSAVLPLVGYWDLVRRFEESQARLGELAVELRAQAAERAARAAEVRAEAAQLRAETAELRAGNTQLRAEAAELRAQAAAEADRAEQRHAMLLARSDDAAFRMAALAADGQRMAARDGPLAVVVAAEIDRLDRYLVHHATALRGSVETLRAAPAYAACGFDALVVAGEFDLVVPAAEDGLLAYVLRHGLDTMEPGVRALLRRRLQPGAVAVDAGANIGLHSLAMAAAVGPRGRVLCFEPLQHLASALERSLRLNGFADRAKVERAALADRPGEETFHRAAHGPMSSLYALPQEMAAEDVRVPVTTLDANLPAGSRVDFVKMDVEGAEPRAWRGMERVVAENPGIEVVLEWSASHFRRSGEDPRAFMAAIMEAGFHAFAVEDGEAPGRLAPVGDPAALEGVNLLLTRQTASDGVRAA